MNTVACRTDTLLHFLALDGAGAIGDDRSYDREGPERPYDHGRTPRPGVGMYAALAARMDAFMDMFNGKLTSSLF